jgi:hypothetical protein
MYCVKAKTSNFHYLNMISSENRSYNIWARIKSFVFILLGLVMPFALILSVLAKQGDTLQRLIGENMVETLHIYTVSDDSTSNLCVPNMSVNTNTIIGEKWPKISILIKWMKRLSGKLRPN